jgi:hypothetical protein
MRGGRPASNGSADDGGKMTKSAALTGASDGWCTDRHDNNGHRDVHGKYQVVLLSLCTLCCPCYTASYTDGKK